MKKYKVAQACEEELSKLNAKAGKTERDELRERHALALAEAVDGIAALSHKEVYQRLSAWIAKDSESHKSVKITHESTFMSSRDPFFWCACFVRLFGRGDCQESCRDRRTSLSHASWANSLLTRADFPLWRMDVEFVASLFNVFLRRDQMRAVEAHVRKYHTQELFDKDGIEQLQSLSATGLVAQVLASGDVDSVKKALQKKDLDKGVERALRDMQICLRKVRGSEEERDTLIYKFRALRIWSGCSSLFFTLNPHDIRSPLTIMLLSDTNKFERRFSLDLSDEEAAEYAAHIVKGDPRRLHVLVAQDPLVATRVFHWTVRLVIRTLFNCADKPGCQPDNIASTELPGIFGHVRAYFGVVEPQMRKALHVHMLVQLLGFSHPDICFPAAWWKQHSADCGIWLLASIVEAQRDSPITCMSPRQ